MCSPLFLFIYFFICLFIYFKISFQKALNTLRCNFTWCRYLTSYGAYLWWLVCAISLFCLFTWRYFVFSLFRFAFFRNISSFRLAKRRKNEIMKWHKPATILTFKELIQSSSTARWIGANCSPFRIAPSAPRLSRKSITSTLPAKTAKCNGVLPFLSARLMSVNKYHKVLEELYNFTDPAFSCWGLDYLIKGIGLLKK